MENNFSIIISTCDKFSDLWDAHILLLNQNWADRNVETFLVTDKPTDRTFENVTVVAAGEGTEITERLKVVLPLVKTEYVLFTLDDYCNGVQREHNKKLNNGLPILHKVPPKRDYGRYFCIMAEKGGTSHGGLTEKLSLFFHAKKQEVNAYGR